MLMSATHRGGRTEQFRVLEHIPCRPTPALGKPLNRSTFPGGDGSISLVDVGNEFLDESRLAERFQLRVVVMADRPAIGKDVNHRRHLALLHRLVEMRRERDALRFAARTPAMKPVDHGIAAVLVAGIVVTGRQVNAVADIDAVRGAAEGAVPKAGVLVLREVVDPLEGNFLLGLLGGRRLPGKNHDGQRNGHAHCRFHVRVSENLQCLLPIINAPIHAPSHRLLR